MHTSATLFFPQALQIIPIVCLSRFAVSIVEIRYAGQNEVRFKVTDKQKEIYLETARYLYEINKMDKSKYP